MKKNIIKKIFAVFIILFCVVLSSCAQKEVQEKIESEQVTDDGLQEFINEVENNLREKYENSEAVPLAKEMKILTLGKYEQDGDESNGKEDIEWYVIGSKGDNAILLSKYILDCKNFSDEELSTNYENSSIRKWLNNDFYNEAFSNENDKMCLYSFVGGELNDKIGLLSMSDIENYFENVGFNNKKNDYDKEIKILSAKATDYAIKQGVEYDKNDNIWSYKNGSYHLMDTVEDDGKAMWVGQKGHVYTKGQNVKLNSGDGVRPIIIIGLSVTDRAKSEEEIKKAENKKIDDEMQIKREKQLEELKDEPLHIEDDGNTCYVHDYAGGFLDMNKYGKFKKLVFSENKISYITDMSRMFSETYLIREDYDNGDYYGNTVDGNYVNNIEEVDFTGLDTSNVRTMEGLFNCNSKIRKVTFGDIDTSKVETMYKMFNDCPNLEEVDFGNFNTSNVKTMRGMFFYDTKLKKVDLSKFDTRNVEEFGYMFYKCLSLTNLDLSNFVTTSAKRMEYMFANMRNLETLNIPNFDTKNVTTMARMFYRDEKIQKLDLGSFDTSKVKSMNYMFYCCYNLKDLDISNFTIDNIQGMSSMFHFCNSIEKLDLHKFVNEKEIAIDSLFRYCEELKELDISGMKFSIFDFGKDGFYTEGGYTGYYAKNSVDTVFDGCTKLIYPKYNTSDYNVKPDNYKFILELEKNKNIIEYADTKKTITNRDIMYMGIDGWDKLLKNEFVVKNKWEYKEFFNYYEEARYNHFPNYVTSDSMLHVFHLYFDYLMKSIEGNKLYDKIYKMTLSLYEKSKNLYDISIGTDLENHAKAVVGYFAVPAKLFDNNIKIPDYVKNEVEREVEKILSHSEVSKKEILNYFYNFEMESQDVNYESYFLEDYTQYKPRGHYAGDEKLEKYFKIFMWYGRTDFTSDIDDFSICAMLINYLLNDEKILKEYNEIKNTIYYFAGTSDDCGFEDYIAVIQKVFGNGYIDRNKIDNDMKSGSIKMIAYFDGIKNLRNGKINSKPGVMELEKRDGLSPSFRMIGQTYTIDAEIYQKLIYDYVKKLEIQNENGEIAEYKRGLPDFLDIPASFYSKTAENILRETKDRNGLTSFDYPGYQENLMNLQKDMPNKIKNDNSDVLYVKWLKCLLNLVDTENNDNRLPSYMKKSEHKKKSLETFAGSYAELKHDTILYAKQTYGVSECGEGGDDEFWDTEDVEIDNRGYVEPQMELYISLYEMADSMYNNFKQFDVISEMDAKFINNFSELSKKLAIISNKELNNEKLTNEEYELIDGYGATIEHLLIDSGAYDAYNQSNPQKSKAIVADVATTDNQVLELATGNPTRIYVLVNVQGKYKICSGAVYDFYQFEVPDTERMTDIEWRMSMGFDDEMFDNDYDGSTSAFSDEAESGIYKSEEHDYKFQDWTNSYKYDNYAFTERYNYYTIECGSAHKINICQLW